MREIRIVSYRNSFPFFFLSGPARCIIGGGSSRASGGLSAPGGADRLADSPGCTEGLPGVGDAACFVLDARSAYRAGKEAPLPDLPWVIGFTDMAAAGGALLPGDEIRAIERVPVSQLMQGADGRVLPEHILAHIDHMVPQASYRLEVQRAGHARSVDVPARALCPGLHLEQYRHATRHPEFYWREALRRDPGDARCHLALGRWHLRRGELAEAEKHLRASIARATARNPNPADGEAHYQLGRCLRSLEATVAPKLRRSEGGPPRDGLTDAYTAFYKATWNHAWQSAAFHALAQIDCTRGNWTTALAHLDRCLATNAEHTPARNLRALVLRRLGRSAEADALLKKTLATDPLDWWARDLRGEKLTCDNQVRLDLALDYARAGFAAEALAEQSAE